MYNNFVAANILRIKITNLSVRICLYIYIKWQVFIRAGTCIGILTRLKLKCIAKDVYCCRTCIS